MKQAKLSLKVLKDIAFIRRMEEKVSDIFSLFGCKSVNCNRFVFPGIKSHPLFKSGDLGEWSKHHDEDWLIWKGRQDDVVKIFGK